MIYSLFFIHFLDEFFMELFFLLKLRKTLYITMYKLFYNLRIFRFKWNYDI